MKFLKYGLLGISLLVGLGFALLSFYPGPAIVLDTAGQFTYAPLDEITLNAYKKKKTYVVMSDGTKIATNIFLPTGQVTKEVPTVFIFTPYNRSMVVPNMKWWERCAAKAFLGTWGPVFDAIPTRKTINTLTSNGYAIVVADMRGTGASSGFTSAMSPQLRKDGIEMINWIATQTWSNGKVGMQGPSYLGWIQLAIASEKPAALKCISPSIMGSDIYTEAQKQGGILMTKWTRNFDKQLRLLNLNASDRTNTIPVFPSEPVIDEDGDGSIADEIPLYTNDAATLFVDDTEPTYADGVQRKENIYFNHTKEHLKDIWTMEVIKDWQYRDDKITIYGDSMSLEDITPGFFVPGIKASKIPILMTGGWFDGFEGITKLFGSLQTSNPAHLVMVPRFHVPLTVPAAYKEFLNYQGEYEDQLLSLRMQFFDYYLKGIDNGYTQIPPVQLYTAFKGWESYQNYPPKKTAYQHYYFNENKLLTTDTSITGKDTYTIDFSHSAGYDAEGDNRWNMAAMTDSIMKRTELDKKCLVYQTETLEKDLQITGHTIVDLNLSANQPDADIYIYLSDVDENGTVYYVAEGQLRAGWHQQVPDDEQVNYMYDVQPNLPWHGFDKDGYDAAPFAANKVINMRLDLTPVSWVFKKGHSLRVSIAGADFENFELHPTLCPDNQPTNCKATTIVVNRGSTYLSRIELPVIE